jgi:hypothetical protein
MKKEKTSALEFTVALAIILATPLLALFSALIYRALWNLTLATQYSDGPTLKSWFGVALLAGMLTQHLAQKKRKQDQKIWEDVLELGAWYVGRLFILLLALATCWALGW